MKEKIQDYKTKNDLQMLFISVSFIPKDRVIGCAGYISLQQCVGYSEFLIIIKQKL